MNAKKNALLVCAACACGALFAQKADVVNTVNDDMIAVAGGTFLMGAENTENNESPVHEVVLNDFLVLRTEVTQSEYEAVMGENLSHFQGEDRPVEEVSWYDAVVFCNRLSILAGLEPAYSLAGAVDPAEWGEIPRIDASDEEKAAWNAIECNFKASGYRLPTEAEWEYAARGGQSSENFLYSGSSDIGDVAWNADAVDGETHDVASLTSNELGIFDMSGNVWEWCWDWYGNYHKTDRDNPLGASAEITGRKMRRGGSIASDAVFCRSANRASSTPDIRGIDLGFRVVRTASEADLLPAGGAEK